MLRLDLRLEGFMNVVTRIAGRPTLWRLGLAALAAIVPATMPIVAGGAEPGLERIDTFIRAEMARQKVPGVAVAIVTKNGVLAAKGYGLANVEHNVAVSPDTIFQSGSVGKQFTSTAVMLLVEQGKIGLEDQIAKYFPDAPASWKTSGCAIADAHGIPDYEESKDGPASVDLRRDYPGRADALRLLLTPSPPGSRWNYSNTGYVLLGIIIHKTSSSTATCCDRVFQPLGMTTARIISEEDIVLNRSGGYRLVKGALKNQDWVAPSLNTTADGALYLSLRDMIAWDKGLRAGAILKPASWARVNEPVKLNSGHAFPYGFGWSVDTLNGSVRLHHGGSWQGFKTYISRYLGDELTIIVLANLAESDPERFVDGIAGILSPALAPPELKPIPDTEPEVRTRLDGLLRLARDGQLSPAEFAYLRAGFFPDGARVYQDRLSKLGAIQNVTLLQRKVLGDDRVYTYELHSATDTMIVTLGLAPDAKVSQFSIRPKDPPLAP
jgi:CubicO group peptidase (beta-lactamase class C family)